MVFVPLPNVTTSALAALKHNSMSTILSKNLFFISLKIIMVNTRFSPAKLNIILYIRKEKWIKSSENEQFLEGKQRFDTGFKSAKNAGFLGRYFTIFLLVVAKMPTKQGGKSNFPSRSFQRSIGE